MSTLRIGAQSRGIGRDIQSHPSVIRARHSDGNTKTDMFHFFSLSSSRWNTSRFSELPTLDDDDDIHLDYRLLAGGLALLLSRCSENRVERDFAASLEAYRSLKSQLKSSAPVTLSAQLLMDLSHEIAQCADNTTRMAARRCLARSMPVSASAPRDLRPLPSH